MMQAAENCEDLLDNNAYFCQVTPQIGSDFTFGDCFLFNSASPVLGDFDLTVAGLGETLGCSCETKKVTKFKQTKRFLCVTAEQDDNVSAVDAVAFEGKVTGNGKKIKKGQVVFEDGHSFIFNCELDPSCAP
jgi:hypothetical protein